ncbi:MAG TPA: hypothetical protein VK177_15700 [Flavobacteriales bacterium]|nr:hypothetical protein [Flavobacteriales bacterium]
MTIADYAKLTTPEQTALLKKAGVFVDSYTENKKLVIIYWIFGFYVEISTTETMVEIIPFKRGYRMADVEDQPQSTFSCLYEQLIAS